MGDLLDVGVADAAEDAPVELPLDDAGVHADVEELARGDVELSTGEPFLSDQLGCQLQAHRAPTDLAGDAPGDHQVGDAAVEQVADRASSSSPVNGSSSVVRPGSWPRPAMHTRSRLTAGWSCSSIVQTPATSSSLRHCTSSKVSRTKSTGRSLAPRDSISFAKS